MTLQLALREIAKRGHIENYRLVELVDKESAVIWYRDFKKKDFVTPVGKPTYQLPDLPAIISLTKTGKEHLKEAGYIE